VVWKELRAPFIQGIDNRNSYIGLTLTILALLATYILIDRDEDFAHVMYVMLFIFLGVVVNILFSATRITTEKESQSWSLLLATPLSDWEILFGQAVGAFRRCLPIWGLLAGHVVLFVLLGYIHPIAFLHLALLVAWLTCFLTGVGLYFSTRFARTTSAVSFALFLASGRSRPIVIRLLGVMAGEATWSRLHVASSTMQTNAIRPGRPAGHADMSGVRLCRGCLSVRERAASDG
jgi:ABC-type transport system involved in multi-copper enzyme maturation permease subunit